MKKLSQFVDEHGTIFHGSLDDRDYGDGLARFAIWKLCEEFIATNQIEKSIHRAQFISKHDLFFKDEEPIRHPNPGWWSMKGTASGDQLEPLICCYLSFGLKRMFWSMMFKLLKRGFFAWNTKKIGQHDEAWKIPDFVGIRFFGYLIRGLCGLPVFGLLFYPIVTLWDLGLLLSCLVRVLVPIFDRDNVGDDLNFTARLICYKRCFPTVFSWFFSQVYLAFRPVAGDRSFRRSHRGWLGPVTAFKWYFRWDSAPPLDDVLSKAVIRL